MVQISINYCRPIRQLIGEKSGEPVNTGCANLISANDETLK